MVSPKKYSGHRSRHHSKEKFHPKTAEHPEHKDKSWRYKYVHPSKKGKPNMPLIVGGGLILLLLLFGGYAVLQLLNTNSVVVTNHGNLSNMSKTNMTNMTNETLATDPNLLLYDAALQKSNYSICLQINDTRIRDKCLGNFSQKNSEACLEVNDTSERYGCISAFAKSRHLISFCDNIVNQSDVLKCKLSVDQCYGLNDTKLKLCKAEQYNDTTLCSGDSQCILNFAKYKNDSSYCNAFTSDYNQNSCKSYMTGTDYCKGMGDTNAGQLCYMKLAEYTLDSSYCSHTVQYTYAQNECYYRVAMETKNFNLCEKEDLTYRWKCYKDYAEKYSDPTGCMKIDPLAEIHYNNCFIHLSVATHNASLCVYLPLYIREKCYASAILGKDRTIMFPADNCKGVTDDAWKTFCYRELAMRTNSTSYCSYIDNDYSKNECIKDVNARLVK